MTKFQKKKCLEAAEQKTSKLLVVVCCCKTVVNLPPFFLTIPTKNFRPFACFPSKGLTFFLSILRTIQKGAEMLRL